MDYNLLQKFLPIFQIERMSGLSNFVYKVYSDDQAIIYRIYSNYFDIFQNRDYETELQNKLSQLGFAPKILYADHKCRLEEFLPYKSVSLQEIKQDANKIAVLLGQIHRLQGIAGQVTEAHSKRNILHKDLSHKIRHILQTQKNTDDSSRIIEMFSRVFSQTAQSKIKSLFDHECLNKMDLVLAHNDLNSTNFLKDSQGSYHLIDWENGGLNYPGYEIANFFNELEWDYTYSSEPYFKVDENAGLNLQERLDFIRSYWTSYTGCEANEIPNALYQQIEIGSVLQNYYWLMIGAMSLQFSKEDLGLNLEKYIEQRLMHLNIF